MLNDWGIHHFHLGTAPHPNLPRFMARTGPLLYAYVTPETLYCVAILKHQEWSNQKLLDEMHKNFLELTAQSAFRSATLKPTGLAVNYSNEDVAKLRAAGINAVTQRPDGTIMAGPGGGVTLDRRRGKQSAKIALAVIDVINIVREAEDVAREKIDQSNVAATVKELDVRLTEADGKLVATDAATGLRIDIDTQIVKPI